MGGRLQTIDSILGGVAPKVGLVATGATGVDDKGDVNVSGIALGVTQTVHGVVDFGTKGIQATNPAGLLGRGIPGVGILLGGVGLRMAWSDPPKNASDWAGVVANGAAVVGGLAVIAGAAPIAVGATVIGIGAGIYQIASYTPRPYAASTPSDYSNEGHNYPTYNASNPQDVFTPPMAIINGTAVNLETATIVMDVATGHLSWTDINVLASEYRSSGLTDPLAYATELAEHAPPEIDALDVFFSAYEAATSSTPSTPSTPGSSSSSSSGAESSPGEGGNYSGVTNSDGGWGWGDGSGGWGDTAYAPIVIDLDGDGVEIKPLTTSTTFFDADNDGYAERTAWAGADDGILMIDLGGDGKVTDAKEVAFANWTTQDDTDLQALATVFDSNADGVFDARDARFREFRLWKDANGNGEVDSGELQTLEQAGVRSMDLKVKDGTALDLGEGSKVHGLFKVELTNGKTVDGADVTFGYSATGVRKGVDAINDVFYWKWA